MSVACDVDTIKASLVSPDACSSATVEALTILLNGATTKKATNSVGLENSTTSSRAKSKTRARKDTVGEDRSNTTKSGGLQPLEKVKLATEVVNICLKTLGQAVQAGGRSTKATSPQKDASSTGPFTPRSLNIPTKTAKLIKSSDGTSKDSGINGIAECGRIALGALRRHNDQSKKQALPELQIELAMSAMVAKLIALEMVDLASKEVRILAKRLDMGVPDSSLSKKPAQGTQSSVTASIPSLVELLVLQQLPGPSSKLSLVFTTQMHILRLLRFAKIIPNPFELHKNLDSTTLSSPCNLLDALVSVDGREKCARLLGGLAHAILLASDRISSKIDKASKSKLDLAHGILQLQLLSLDIQCKSWDLAEHNIDVPGQLCRPFKRYVDSYFSQSTACVEDRYKVVSSAKEYFTAITSKISLSKQQRQGLESAVLDTNQMLYKLSKAAGNHKQSKELAAKAVSSLSGTEVSAFRKGSLLCQLATVIVQDINSASKDDTYEALNKAVQSYSTSTDGSSEDLYELLISISNLRKAATAILTQSSLRQSILEEHRQLFYLLRDCILKFPAFISRYLGTLPENKSSATAGVRYTKRKSLALKVTQSAIESVAVLARLDAQSMSSEWKQYEDSLRSCVTLHRQLDIGNSGDEAESTKKHTPSPILISNAYWFRYLALRQSKDAAQLIPVLQNAVELLQDLSVEHQEIGLFSNKLERLANLQEQEKNWEAASKLYDQVFAYLCQAQLVQIAAEKFRWTPALGPLLEDDKLKLVGKVIDGFCRVTRHLNGFDIQSLCPSDLQPILQGFTMELKLTCLKKQYEEVGDSIHPMVERLGHSLLEIYTEGCFPIRRIRVLGSLAQFDCFLEIPQEEDEDMKALDDNERTLLPFHDHLIARRNAILGMKSLSDSKLLSAALKQWSTLINQPPNASWQTLLKKIDDIQEWTNLLNTIVDYTGVQGLAEQRIAALNLLAHISRQLPVLDPNAIIRYDSSLATELMELDSMDQARSFLLQSKDSPSNAAAMQISIFNWQIARANYCMKIGDLVAAKAAVSAVRAYSKDISNSASRLRSIELTQTQAQHHHISAKYYFALGDIMKSVYHVKQSVRLLLQAWSVTERKCGKPDSLETKSPIGEDNSTLKTVDGDESLATNDIISNSDIKKKSTKFWPLVQPLFESLMDASRIFSHVGQISESRYYVLEAMKIAESISAPVLKIRAFLMQGNIEIKGGDQATGSCLYEQAKNILQSCRSLASTQATLLGAECTIFSSQLGGDHSVEDLDEVYASVDKLMPIRSSSFQTQDLDLNEVARKMESLEISAKGPRAKTNIVKPSRTTKKLGSKNSGNTWVRHSQETDKISYQQLRRRLLLTKALVLINKGDFSLALTTQKEAIDLLQESQSDLYQIFVSTKLHLEQGLKLLEFDPVLNIIPEAILSQPSAAKLKALPKPVKQGPSSRKGNAGALSRKQQIEKSDYAMHFDQALQSSATAQALPSGISSVLEAHSMANLRLKSCLAMGALSPAIECMDNSTGLLIQHLEHGRNYASALGHATIQADKMLRNSHDEIELDENSVEDLPSEDLEHFKSKYINIIPANWHVVSISVSEDRNELRLGTFESQAEPFVLSIPLNRRTNDGTEMEFTFDHGKKELLRIIDLANFSSHEGADLTKKGSKAEWWEARAALDSRLRDLLVNIENIWLGGFKGILKYCAIDATLAASFGLAFVKILDKYLPSRQARKGQKKTAVVLDKRIVELFIRLGHPIDDENVDEPILDLLYFVIDILWFNGESNVCDEIDFDPMVLEIRDALISYHESMKLSHPERPAGHTILILDKRLHSFPWESLPCMDSQPVCRLPSLYLLRQRILQMHEESDKSQTSLAIDATDGAYILNPSSDLKSTSSTFRQPLSNLTNWTSTINTAPSESDIATALSTKSLYLYFGHGSGGQYIRSRTVRRLDRCAVALLMGCSSASLTEVNDYESHGTLLNYLHAGSPAVVGTLWDVTDKDIDRLSIKMLQQWGLFKEIVESASPVKRSTAKGKGKQKDAVHDFRSGVSLDTAIAQARSSCLMRYLNGAAAVVYGIPVSLK